MNIKFIIIITGLLVSACQAESNISELHTDFQQWLKNSEAVPSHFTLKDGGLYAKKSLDSGGEIHFKETGYACIAYAPHRFYDLHTLDIARSLFNDCQVLLTNTKHRTSRDANGVLIDFGKYKESAANAFILAYADTVESFTIFQLHGFAKEKRKTNQGRKADIIVSQGRENASLFTRNITDCLNEKLNVAVMLYGRDIYELGGTKNILTTLAPSNSQFIHIELSREIREKLITDNHLLKLFKQCLTS